MQSRFFKALRPAAIKPGARVCTLVVDAEESFDWRAPVRGTAYTTSGMRNVRELHRITSVHGIVPAHLLTYPLLENPAVVSLLRDQVERGLCILGLQMHTWVTPPFDTDIGAQYSFSGNLRANLEEQKLIALKARFVECFGYEPVVYRSGRYGLSGQTASLLEKHGFTIDTSVAPRTTSEPEGGPDYSDFDYGLFWFGERRNLLEMPLCRSMVGWGGLPAQTVYRGAMSPFGPRSDIPAVFARSRCIERITLSPEGNDLMAMRRLVRGLCARGQTVLALSFHSSSLEIGGSPYVTSKAELHEFYDRLSGVLDWLAHSMDFEFTDILQVPDHLEPASQLGLHETEPADFEIRARQAQAWQTRSRQTRARQTG